MRRQASTTFDMADHYGSAEDITGRLFERIAEAACRRSRARFHQVVPVPGPMTREVVRAGVGRSLERMKRDRARPAAVPLVDL